jgi:protein arginine N-methyltransferase 1
MYSLDQFARMFSDRLRMDAYSSAISTYVKPGDVVLDLGCGPGVFALLACKAGARRVYAIDLNGIVEFGRHLAAVNGMGDRVHFLRGDSQLIHLPERADVIVSDVRGVLPLYSDAIATLEDARSRFLAEGGKMLPSSDTMICAVVEIPKQYHEIADAWKSVPGLDLSAGLPLVLNGVYHEHIKPEQLVSGIQPWHTLDYATGAKTAVATNLELRALRDAVGHGLGLWFETRLGEFGYSTAPGAGDRVYGHTFLPWLEPVPFREGDVCKIGLRAHLVGGSYVWQWETCVPASTGRAAVHFKQSTFYGSLFSPSSLKKHTTDFVPVLSEAGLAERWLLQSMDGTRTLEEIASGTARLFPHIFRRVEDALTRAADLAEKLAR